MEYREPVDVFPGRDNYDTSSTTKDMGKQHTVHAYISIFPSWGTISTYLAANAPHQPNKLWVRK